MTKEINKTAVGIFIIGAIAIAVFGIVIFGSGKFFTKKTTYVLYFDGSVKGLQIGAPVMFRGVKVGTVKKIVLSFQKDKMEFIIPVIIEIERNRITAVQDITVSSSELAKELIERGLRAQLQMQSFVTGMLFVDIDLYPDTKPRLLGLESEYDEIPTIPTGLQQITETFSSIVDKIKELRVNELIDTGSKTLENLNEILNSPDLKNSLTELDQLLQNTNQLVKTYDERGAAAITSLEETLEDARHLIKTYDEKGNLLLTESEDTVESVKSLTDNINDHVGPISENIMKTTEKAIDALSQAEQMLKTAEDSVSIDSELIYEFKQALKEISASARSIRFLADYLEKNPNSLIRGKQATGGNQ